MEKKQNNLLKPQSIEELIEDQVQREDGLKSKPVKPLQSPVLAQPHTAIYKMHRYWARRPHNVFAHIIQHYTNPGDLVLDPFCGGGVTVVESLKLRRRVVGIDVNPLATWITQVEVEPVDLDELEKAFNEWYEWCVEQVSPLFKAECGKCGNPDAQAEWYEWSNVVVCPECGKDVVLADAKKEKNAVYTCTNEFCSTRFKPSGLERRSDKMMLVKTRCDICKETDVRKPKASDLELAGKIERDEKRIVKKEKLFIPDDKFPDMNHVRENDLYSKGFYYFRDYFTPRQRIAIGRIHKILQECLIEGAAYYSILTAFTSSLRNTNKLAARNVNWRGGNPEWGGHMYWPPNIYCEASPMTLLVKAINSQIKGKKYQKEEIGKFYNPHNSDFINHELIDGRTCVVLTKSSENIPLFDETVNAIVTDPPFGGNVQYLELSDFYLVWLKRLVQWDTSTNKSREAIQTRHQGFEGAKDMEHYERVLYNVFKECRRVLKPDGYMVMTFHNTDVRVWVALHNAVRRAGFRLPSYEEVINRGILYQPAIKNYTQTIHQKRTGSLLGDFILTFIPTEIPAETEIIRMQLTLDEEQLLHGKCEEIIRYHGGLDEPSLWSAILPFLYDSGFLGRILQFDFRMLLQNGPFEYRMENKKKMWYMKDMMENGQLKAMDVIPAEQRTLQIIQDYFKRNETAEMDDLLITVYSQLVNSKLPRIETIQKVLTTYCQKKKVKGTKRDVYTWKPGRKSSVEIARIKARQNSLAFDSVMPADHNAIIEVVASSAFARDLDVHIGKTEQRKSPALRDMSLNLTGLELGLTPEAFKVIQEIDLLILEGRSIVTAIEVTTTISTMNKALNDRYRNLLTLVPNLKVDCFIVIKDEDYNQAYNELHTPANLQSGLSDKVELVKLSQLNSQNVTDIFIKG